MNAFSLYTSETESINQETADAAVKGILNYMAKQGIIDPYSGEVCEEVVSPITGTVFFMHNAAMTYSNAALFKIIPLKEF